MDRQNNSHQYILSSTVKILTTVVQSRLFIIVSNKSIGLEAEVIVHRLRLYT